MTLFVCSPAIFSAPGSGANANADARPAAVGFNSGYTLLLLALFGLLKHEIAVSLFVLLKHEIAVSLFVLLKH